MVRHVVLYSFVPEHPPEGRAAIVEGLVALVGVVPGLVAMKVGTDLGLMEGNFDLGIVADFVDAAAFDTYVAHPAHVEVRDTLIRPVTTNRAAIQYELV